MELLQLIEDWKGYSVLSEIRRPEGYEQRLKETIDLLSNARGIANFRHEYQIREAMTTSDFPLLFGDVLDRQVLASYKAVDPVWKKIVRMGTVNRLFPHVGGKRFAIHGGNAVLPVVAEKGEYLARSKSEVKYDVYAYKRGAQFDISWETLLADDLGALKDTPEVFAWAAINTEHWLATSTYAGDLGTHGANNLYDDVTGNEINSGVLPLTIRNLEATVAAMHMFRDRSLTIPIKNRPKYLVVPPRLEFTARQILTSASKMWVEHITRAGYDPAETQMPYPTTNVIAQYGLELIVDPWLPLVDTDYGDYSWYLFADPKDIAAIEVDHLTGHARPEICMKASDKVTIGGGPIGPMSGDFATDNILYRVRVCVGANKLDWRATYQQAPGVASP